MNLYRGLVGLCALLMFLASAQAQGSAKHFAKDGLSFDYLDGWTVVDKSNSDAQDLTLTRSDNDAQIRVYVHRGRVDSPEKMAQAKKAFIDPYISATNNQFVQMGAKPERSADTTEIGGAPAEGVKLRASLSGEGGEATIYWLTLGNRVLVLTRFGSDKDLKRAATAWDGVRTSIKIEAVQAKPSPTPKANP
ncbi:MAG TPA: hypothetical protein VKD91_05775 [Pyrinomonadaceae bacterium]|nr:hypothetical protein [Pyrinomonadaceae bacterium]